jgi:H+/Cl- antiporter ClcA
MSLIFAASNGEEKVIPKRLVPLIMVSTWITHLFGGSAGREGVAVQIGGTVGHTLGRTLSKSRIFNMNVQEMTKLLLITGMGAGFAGLFQTPIAAIFFALEVLMAGTIMYRALFPCMIASIVASLTSHTLGLEKFSVDLKVNVDFNPSMIGKLILLGILFGIVGGLFTYLLKWCKDILSKYFANPILKVFIIGCVLSVLLLVLYQGRYSGLGTNLIGAAFHNEPIYSYDWIIKIVLTIVTLSAGFQGGEVTPLFSIGASFGVVIAGILGVPLELAAALGYAAVFGSATNTLLAPIFIGVEVFGYEYLPYFVVSVGIAYVFNGNKSIYASQKIEKWPL